MPEMDTEAFVMEKAGPDEELRLQSNTVLPFEPVMLTNGTLALMITLDSLKSPVERYSVLALRDWMAYAMVLHGETVSQEDESTPEEGSTMTETSAAPAP